MRCRSVSENEKSGGFDGLEYVRVTPPMVQASVIGHNDGRCAVAFHGAAGRCSSDAEYKTTIGRTGEFEYVGLCPKHAGREADR